MNNINKLFNKIGEIIRSYFHRLILKHSKEKFTFFSNLYFFSRNKKIRFKYNKEEKIYLAKQGRDKLFFMNRSQAIHAYDKGLTERSQLLGETYFLDKIEFSKNDLIIDCGANVGDLYLYLKNNLKDEFHYIGFEPSPSEYYALEKNVGEQNAKNIGLWDNEKIMDFFVSSDGADSSLIEPPDFEEIISVKTKKLEKLFEGHKIKLLKLEAEGGEPEVLMGTLNILENIQYISADLDRERGISQESTLVPVINLLLKRGFEIENIRHDRIIVLFKNKNFKD